MSGTAMLEMLGKLNEQAGEQAQIEHIPCGFGKDIQVKIGHFYGLSQSQNKKPTFESVRKDKITWKILLKPTERP